MRPAARPGFQRRSSSELLTTETDDNAIAAPAITGIEQPERRQRDTERVVDESEETDSGGS